jgi:hypothetical protein
MLDENNSNGARKGQNVEEVMSKKELKEKISKKKAELAPYVKELKALREVFEVFTMLYLSFPFIIKNI